MPLLIGSIDPVNLTTSPGPAQEIIAIHTFVSPLPGAHVTVRAGGPDHHAAGPFKYRLSQAVDGPRQPAQAPLRCCRVFRDGRIAIHDVPRSPIAVQIESDQIWTTPWVPIDPVNPDARKGVGASGAVRLDEPGPLRIARV